jgi:hypothetical protein
MRKLIFAAAVLAFGAFAHAAERPVVVELFTSQGCSSCPPADKFMEELAAKPGVVALTLPVDIWDYLGWTDSFAKHEYSVRQQSYAPHMPSRSVYTPQMVIGGSADIVGSRREDALALIETVGAPGNPGADLTLAINGDVLAVELKAPPEMAGTKATVWLARLLSRREVTIGSGENNGKTITYSNIVRELSSIGAWDGSASATFQAPVRVDGGEPCDRLAVFVQKDDLGPIVAAGLIDVPRALTAGGEP